MLTFLQCCIYAFFILRAIRETIVYIDFKLR